MARKHRKSHRRSRRRPSRRLRRQHGGAFGIDVAHPIQTASGAPLEARLSVEDGAPLDRPAPAIGNPGGVLSMMGGRRKTATRRRKSRRQRGGACGCMGIQRGGGGSGTGGYGFVLNNDVGKVYADLTRGSCTLPQRGGSASPALIGVSESNGQLVSHSAGFGFDKTSGVEVNNGTAHYLEAVRYARGGRRRTRHRHSRRCGHKKQSRRQRS